ncbi:hypothetical protein EGW08_007234, partial [Elysia chlorotica]
SPVQEGEPLEQEAPRVLHPLEVGAPVLQAKVAEVPEHVQTLVGRDVPVALLANLAKPMNLPSQAPGQHDTADSVGLHVKIGLFKRQDTLSYNITEDWHGGSCGRTLPDVVPVRLASVALLSLDVWESHSDEGHASISEPGDDLVRHIAVVKHTLPELHGEGRVAHHPDHAAADLLQLGGLTHEGTASTL